MRPNKSKSLPSVMMGGTDTEKNTEYGWVRLERKRCLNFILYITYACEKF